MADKHIKIALTGKMRVGKDTVYQLLMSELFLALPEENQHTDYFYASKFAFGDALKMYAEAIFPEQFVGGKKPRELFQDFGQSLRRINPEVWVNKVADKVHAQGFAPQKLVVSCITDLRQPNEYKYCRDNDFYIIKVTAPDEIRLSRMNSEGDNFSPKSLEHETELHIDSYETDYIVNNYHNDMKMLKVKVQQLAKDILIKEEILTKEKERV